MRLKRFTKTLAAIALVLPGLLACRATQFGAVSKDTTYDPATMRRVFVVAVVKTDRIQKMLEDEFVRQLSTKGREAIASYTLVPHENKLDLEAWKALIKSNGCDTVVISRLVDMKEEEKDMDAKVIRANNSGSGYNYYGSAYSATYQPSSYVRERTAMIETKVFDVAGDRQVWSAHSTTEIAWGGDPEVQIRDFVKTLIQKARR